MNKVITIMLLAYVTYLCDAQTFQYSRGWTNGKRSSTDNPIHQQMTPNQLIQALTSNDININHERLIQHIIKDPCSLRMALLANHNFKAPNEDYNSAQAPDSNEDPQDNRFKRELLFKQ
ncbi:unnamed protein product [Diamesa tonsa]